MTDVKHDANWLHSNGFDSKDIGNVRGAKAYIRQNQMNRSDPFTDKDANYLYALVGRLAQILDVKEAEEEVERILTASDEEILAEARQLSDDVEGDVARMRQLIKKAVDRANSLSRNLHYL